MLSGPHWSGGQQKDSLVCQAVSKIWKSKTEKKKAETTNMIYWWQKHETNTTIIDIIVTANENNVKREHLRLLFSDKYTQKLKGMHKRCASSCFHRKLLIASV